MHYKGERCTNSKTNMPNPKTSPFSCSVPRSHNWRSGSVRIVVLLVDMQPPLRILVQIHSSHLVVRRLHSLCFRFCVCKWLCQRDVQSLSKHCFKFGIRLVRRRKTASAQPTKNWTGQKFYFTFSFFVTERQLSILTNFIRLVQFIARLRKALIGILLSLSWAGISF